MQTILPQLKISFNEQYKIIKNMLAHIDQLSFDNKEIKTIIYTYYFNVFFYFYKNNQYHDIKKIN